MLLLIVKSPLASVTAEALGTAYRLLHAVQLAPSDKGRRTMPGTYTATL